MKLTEKLDKAFVEISWLACERTFAANAAESLPTSAAHRNIDPGVGTTTPDIFWPFSSTSRAEFRPHPLELTV